MKHSFLHNTLLGVGGATAALLAMLLARSSGGFGDTSSTNASSSLTPSGLVVAKDINTDQLRAPTAQEMADLAAARPATKGGDRSARQKIDVLPNGAVVTTLDSSFDLYTVVAKDSNGKLHEACVPSSQIDAALKAAQNGDSTMEENSDEK